MQTTPDTSFAPGRPTIVVLCGSTRFWAEFAEANVYETAAGRIVLAPGCNLKEPHPLWADPDRAEQLKQQLDYLHQLQDRSRRRGPRRQPRRLHRRVHPPRDRLREASGQAHSLHPPRRRRRQPWLTAPRSSRPKAPGTLATEHVFESGRPGHIGIPAYSGLPEAAVRQRTGKLLVPIPSKWEPSGMGHHSTLTVGVHDFLYTRDGYNEELAALFTEADREHVVPDDAATSEDDWQGDGCGFGYYTTAKALRERLNVQGFTTHRALTDLADAIELWQKTYDGQAALRDQEEQGAALLGYAARRPREPGELLRDIGEAIRPHRPLESFATAEEYFHYEDAFCEVTGDVDDLRWHMETRSLIRLIIDQAADSTRVGLDLSGLTGCCVELDTSQPIARPTRDRQLAALPDNAPLIVLVEGSSDSRLLTDAMHVTHPHLDGFVRFIDYTGAKVRGGAGPLATMVNAFIAAGVAHRFVGIADNDAMAHEAFAKLKKQKLPATCKVLHYPALPLLASYPTIDASSATVTLTDVNGVAGSLEMYLGEDVLTIDGTLAPVELGTFIPAVQRHQGSISKSNKDLVQKAFARKINAARRGQRGNADDWSGVHAIIESIVQAFDAPHPCT